MTVCVVALVRGRWCWTSRLMMPTSAQPDDLARLAAYRGGDTKTLVWIPSFLSNKALADLGRLVVLDYIPAG